MADKSVGELIAAQSVTPTDLFVLEQNGTAKKLTGQILENWLVSFADGHGGIQNIEKVGTNVLADTYRITLADTTTFDFVVTNGRGVSSLEKTGTSGLVDTYTISYNDGTSGAFTVTNGTKGDKGDNTYTWIKYASQEPTAASHSFGDLPDDWIGIYFGSSSTAPTDWQQYSWYQIKGEKGDTGAPATLISSAVEYQVSDSGTIIPSGVWSSSVPVVAQGKYLWTRTTNTFNTGNPVVAYSVSRIGMDGAGSVSSVAGVSPDTDGDVPLTAENVGALPSTGGDLTGELRMNGQPLSGLNAPAANDQAANMGFVNQQVKKAAPRNLLDNSDFRNPVNQRDEAIVSALSSEYFIDRWIGYGAGASFDISSKKMVITNDGSATCGLVQRISADVLTVGKTYTLAFKANVTGDKWYLSYGKTAIANTDSSAAMESGVEKVHIFTFVLPESTDGVFNFRIRSTAVAGTATIEWVALYEGEYTATTLPEYQPKGYGTELLECLRYYTKLIANAITPYPGHITGTTRIVLGVGFVPFRITPTAVMSDDFKLTVRLGTGGYSSIANNNGGHPQSIVGTYVSNGHTAVYFEFGESPGTNNTSVTSNIAEGYLELSADL